MDQTSLIILAILLPTCALIAALGGLSTYLHIHLRRYLTNLVEREAIPKPTAEASSPNGQSGNLPVSEAIPAPIPEGSIPDIQKPNLAPEFDKRVEKVAESLKVFLTFGVRYDRGEADDEHRVHDILERLEYKGLPAATFFVLLKTHETRLKLLTHLFWTLALARTSLDGDAQSSILPFTPDGHRELSSYFNALRGLRCKLFFQIIFPSDANASVVVSYPTIRVLEKIPDMTATEYQAARENQMKVVKLFFSLIEPYKSNLADLYRPVHRGGPPNMANLHKIFDEAVDLRVQMLKSFRNFEFNWRESIENRIHLVARPELRAYADFNGELLQTPEILEDGDFRDIPLDYLSSPRFLSNPPYIN